jgi:drug/metabolite transporter (DMT)-like permease
MANNRSRLIARANENRPLLGIAMMLAAYFVFSLIDISAKWLALAGLPALQLSFMRYIGHFAISLVLITSNGLNVRHFHSKNIGLVILRAVMLMFSTVLNFFALRYIPLTLTSTILFSAPIIICGLSWPLLGERVGQWRWLAILAGFCGILIAIRPFGEDFHWAVFLSFSGAISFAIYSILTRKLAGTVAIDTMQFYSGAVGTMVLAPFALMEWQNPVGLWNWALMFGLGFFGWLGHQILTGAHSFATAAALTPFGYSFMLYLTIWSYLIYDHLPTIWTITGGSIMVASGVFIWMRERQLAARATGSS